MNPDQDPSAAADAVNYPDYDYAVTDGINQIQTTIESYADQTGFNNFSDPDYIPSLFSGAESLSQVFEIASNSCSPLSFGSHALLDLCPYAPIS